MFGQGKSGDIMMRTAGPETIMMHEFAVYLLHMRAIVARHSDRNTATAAAGVMGANGAASNSLKTALPICSISRTA